MSLQWQCSGCSWGFYGQHHETCPSCSRVGFWSGSVYPDAKPWPGVVVTSWVSAVYGCMVGTVWHGKTTPWAWARLEGLLLHLTWCDGHTYCRGVSGKWGRVPPGWKLGEVGAEPNERVWLTSERRPESR